MAYRNVMKLHEQVSAATHRVSRYGEGRIVVGENILTAPFMLDATQLVSDWVGELAALDATALAPLWPMEPRIVLLGHAAPDPTRWRALRAECAAHGAALEVMDLGAACRTFNVLVGEDRAVAALLFP